MSEQAQRAPSLVEIIRAHCEDAKKDADAVFGSGANYHEGYVWGYFDGLQWALNTLLGLPNDEDEC